VDFKTMLSWIQSRPIGGTPMLPRIVLGVAVLTVVTCTALPHLTAQEPQATIALVNGKWFNGTSFETRTSYSVNGRLTFEKRAHVDRTVDLSGTWIVPPFADAHNHSLGGTLEDLNREVIRHDLTDGVFYVQIQGNLPLSEEMKRRLSLNTPRSIDALLAQGAQLTSSGGYYPGRLADLWLSSTMYAGFTRETLKDYRYFTIDSEAELDKKWPAILDEHPDFVKTMLVFSESYEESKAADSAYFGWTGLDPHLLPRIVDRAHARNLRVSTHVMTAGDFHNAVAAGADIIAHFPPLAGTNIRLEDVKLVARRGIPVITTVAAASHISDPFFTLARLDRIRALELLTRNLKLFHDQGVALAIGSDNPGDSSLNEVEYIHNLGVFDNLTLLKMWTEATPKAIFPDRKIGALKEGYEASFLALEGNPLDDFLNVKRITLRFKQGVELVP
jgi:imidazolonepropionase-like amidohydrolase